MNALRAMTRSALALAFIVGTSCSSCGDREQADASVYSSFLAEWLATEAREEGGDHSCIVLLESSTGGPDFDKELSPAEIETIWRRRHEQMPELRRDTFEDFVGTNKVSVRIDTSAIKTSVSLIVLTQSEVTRLFARPSTAGGGVDWLAEGWEAFYRRFPGAQGYMQLSRVGVSRDSTQALLYCEFCGGAFAGAGLYYVLDASSGRWSIRATCLVRQA
jgi:hypothetical protein